MPIVLQMYSVFKNRWCGAYWQSMGKNVIPTISWSDERSFKFCFDGIEQESIVAVSTHGNQYAKDDFMKGYNELLLKIKPRAIMCYGKSYRNVKWNYI